jgi:hypothetical protein
MLDFDAVLKQGIADGYAGLRLDQGTIGAELLVR